MDALRPHANGHHTHFMPQGPESIIFTLGRHEAQIAHLTTQVTDLQKTAKRRRRAHSFPWKDALPFMWGALLLLLAWLSPQTVEMVAKLLPRG